MYEIINSLCAWVALQLCSTKPHERFVYYLTLLEISEFTMAIVVDSCNITYNIFNSVLKPIRLLFQFYSKLVRNVMQFQQRFFFCPFPFQKNNKFSYSFRSYCRRKITHPVSGNAILYIDDDIDIIQPATHRVLSRQLIWGMDRVERTRTSAKIVSSIMHQTLNIFRWIRESSAIFWQRLLFKKKHCGW